MRIKSPGLLSKTLPAHREETGRRNQKTMWPFLKRSFKYTVGVALSISGGEAGQGLEWEEGAGEGKAELHSNIQSVSFHDPGPGMVLDFLV